jgi:integrase
MLTDTKIKNHISEIEKIARLWVAEGRIGAPPEITLNEGLPAERGAGSLRLRIRASEGGVAATWLVFWKQGGTRTTKTIGRYPHPKGTTGVDVMTLAVAGEKYRTDYAPKLREGKDPRVITTTAERPTVECLFQGYSDHMKALGRDSAMEVHRALLTAEHNAADGLGRHRLVGTIDASDVVDFLSGFHRRGHRGAGDKARSYIQSAFNWGLKSASDYTVTNRQDWGIRSNPAASVPRDKGAVNTRTRNLSAEELRALWNAVEPGTNGFTLETGTAIRVLIGTGQRVQEVLRMEGADLELDVALWRMPRAKTKGRKRDHLVPLPRQVLPGLQALIDAYGDGLLFPARNGAENVTMCHRSVKGAIDRWLALPNVNAEQFQTRDLRRTWKSRTGEIGISREMRDLIQQHARTDTGSKHYDIADYLPQMRAAMGKYETWLERLLRHDDDEQPMATPDLDVITAAIADGRVPVDLLNALLKAASPHQE